MAPSTSHTANVDIVDIREHDFGSSLAHDIRHGLNAPEGTRRSLPSMLLYDTKGLKLFEEITYLDDYYLTDAEIEVLETHAKEMAERIPDNAQLLELGSGCVILPLESGGPVALRTAPCRPRSDFNNHSRNLRKIEILLREFERTGKRVDYYALDLSLSELQRTFSELFPEQFEHVGFHGLHGTYDDALTWVTSPENRNRPTGIISLGSSLGNFTRTGAAEFLHSFAKVMKPSDFLIVGLDACKDPDRVYKAYNDSKGVTRQFYENGLLHTNRVLGSTAFNLDKWEIVTRYDPVNGRHEAFYSPKQDVAVEGVCIRKGEKLAFEQSNKYGTVDRDRLWHDAGFIHKVEFGNSSDDYRK